MNAPPDSDVRSDLDGGSPLQTLKLARERIELEKVIAENRLILARIDEEKSRITRPWWKNWSIAALIAFATSMIPITAAVQGFFQKEREIALATAKQSFEIEMAKTKQQEEINAGYLNRLNNPVERLRVLRFLEATSERHETRTWAIAEQKIVRDEAEVSAREIQRKTKAAEDLRSAAMEISKANISKGGALPRLRDRESRAVESTQNNESGVAVGPQEDYSKNADATPVQDLLLESRKLEDDAQRALDQCADILTVSNSKNDGAPSQEGKVDLENIVDGQASKHGPANHDIK